MINYLIPSAEIQEQTDIVSGALASKGIAPEDMIPFVIANFRKNAQAFAQKGLDFWLGFGGFLPAVEWIMAKQLGQDEDEFYAHTQYPKMVVDAYSVPANDLATLVAADLYMQAHRANTVPNTASWPLNEDDGTFIDLGLFRNRITGL